MRARKARKGCEGCDDDTNMTPARYRAVLDQYLCNDCFLGRPHERAEPHAGPMGPVMPPRPAVPTVDEDDEEWVVLQPGEDR